MADCINFLWLRFVMLIRKVSWMQVPFYVATKMASIKRSSFFAPSSDSYLRAAYSYSMDRL